VFIKPRSITTQPENKYKAEQRVSKKELTEEKLVKVSAGNVSNPYEQVKFEYTERPTGRNTSN
jgi:hypothetical protein